VSAFWTELALRPIGDFIVLKKSYNRFNESIIIIIIIIIILFAHNYGTTNRKSTLKLRNRY